MGRTADLYAELGRLLRAAQLLGSCGSALSWDEQTYLPPQGAEYRSEQLAMLSGLAHERSTSPRIGELLNELEQVKDLGEADDPRSANVRESRRLYDRATKLPRRLVEELARLTTLAQSAWVTARKESSFSQFRPFLKQMIDLKREEADAVGFGAGVRYDALLDAYEPHVKTAEVAAAFTPLRDELTGLLKRIQHCPKRIDASLLTRRYPKDAQREFARAAAEQIGFDFQRGRIDETAHPFCTGLGPHDIRLTTRYDEHHFPQAFFGVLHEAGHGIYEQGLPADEYGTPLGQAVSLGVHESQSRMWENFVGRSRAFWGRFFPLAQQSFPEALGSATLDELYQAINNVQTSFIRVEADEVTYNLHIMLRFELEQELIGGALNVDDVPEAWNTKFKHAFDLDVPDDARGCLQDIHWSAGLFGYFATYALGNMYAAQLFDAAHRELGDLDAAIGRGEFTPLRTWLNEKIHRHGQRYPARSLIHRATGHAASHVALIRRLNEKYERLYEL